MYFIIYLFIIYIFAFINGLLTICLFQCSNLLLFVCLLSTTFDVMYKKLFSVNAHSLCNIYIFKTRNENVDYKMRYLTCDQYIVKM